MKNPLVTTLFLLVISLGIAQVHFDLAERAYVRTVAATALFTINNVCVQDVNKKIVCVTPGQMAEIQSFISKEMPTQVKDYFSK